MTIYMIGQAIKGNDDFYPDRTHLELDEFYGYFTRLEKAEERVESLNKPKRDWWAKYPGGYEPDWYEVMEIEPGTSDER